MRPCPKYALFVAAVAAGAAGAATAQAQNGRYRVQRLAMVELIEMRGVTDSGTLKAMRAVPRHEFVPIKHLGRAYGDHPLPIGYGQTISQPYIVAYMTEILQPKPGMKILEVGTGSGYQAAVLAQIGCDVYTIEIFEALADGARQRLASLGFDNLTVRHGDGHFGWPQAAPFDAIIVTAAGGYIPPALIEQLKPKSRMIIPVGSVHGVQYLVLVEKDEAGEVTTRSLLPVRFVPMLSGLR